MDNSNKLGNLDEGRNLKSVLEACASVKFWWQKFLDEALNSNTVPVVWFQCIVLPSASQVGDVILGSELL